MASTKRTRATFAFAAVLPEGAVDVWPFALLVVDWLVFEAQPAKISIAQALPATNPTLNFFIFILPNKLDSAARHDISVVSSFARENGIN
jgi:hypothetical protein